MVDVITGDLLRLDFGIAHKGTTLRRECFTYPIEFVSELLPSAVRGSQRTDQALTNAAVAKQSENRCAFTPIARYPGG
jgi:hypothetical protein